jgi:PAS domain S-box-containing protein
MEARNSMQPESVSVAVIDSDPHVRKELAAFLEGLGHRPREFDAPPIKVAAGEIYFDVVIVAWRETDPAAGLTKLASLFKGAYHVIAVPIEAVPQAAELLGQGIDRYILYPYHDNEVEAVLQRIVRRRLRFLTPSMTIAIDATGHVTDVSDEVAQLLGYPPGSLLGMSVEELYEGGRPEAGRVRHAILHSEGYRIEAFPTALHPRNGAPIPISLSARAHFDENGRYIGSVGFFSTARDLTAEARSASARLREAMDGDDYSGTARVMAEELGSEACLVLRYDHRADRLAAVSGFGLAPAEPAADQFPLAGVLGEAFADGASSPRRAVGEDGRPPEAFDSLRARSRHGQIHNYLAVPLIDKTPNGDQPIGVLLFLNKQWGDGQGIDRAGFSWTDETWAGLLGEEIVSLMQYRFHSRSLEALLRVEKGLGGDRDQLLQQIADTLVDQIGYRTAYIRLLRPDDSLRIWASAGEQQSRLVPDMTDPDEKEPFQTTPRGLGIVGRVVKEGKPVAVRDVLVDDGFYYRQVARDAGWRGMLAAPILLQGDTIGVLVCYTGRPHTFSQGEITLAQTFAHLAGLVVSTATMTISRGEELGLINNLLRLARGEPDEKALWGSVLKEMMDRTGAKFGSVTRIDREAGLVRPLVGRGFSPQELAREFPIDGPSVLSWVARHGRHALIKNTATDPHWRGIYLQAEETTLSELAVPIFRGKVPTYILNLESDRIGAFTTEDLLRVEALNILPRIIDQNEALRAPYERQSMRSRATKTAIRQLLQAIREQDLSQKTFLQVILEQAVEIVEGEMGSIHMIDEAGENLILKAAYPPERFPTLSEKAGRLPIQPGGYHRGIVVGAYNLGKADLVKDVRRNRDYLEVDPGSRSALAVYLGDGEKILGTIYVAHRKPNHFKAEHRDTLIALADLAVIALGIPEQAERLAVAMARNTELSQFAHFKAVESIWLHTAKGLIVNVDTYIESYLMSSDLEDLRRAKHVLSRLSDEISSYTNWRLRGKTRKRLDRALDDSVATWRSNLRDVEIVYYNRLSRPLSLKLDWITFHQAFSQLILNAAAALPKSPPEGKPYRGTITVTVSAEDDIVLTIDNDGKRIPPKLLGQLGQVPVVRKGGGSGAYAVALFFHNALGGQVRWENRPPGVRVTITIPRSAATGPNTTKER